MYSFFLSGMAHIVDPCNTLPSRDKWGKDWLWFQKVQDGLWHAERTHEGDETYLELWAAETTFVKSDFKKIGNVGVDSGMLGVFDAAKYPHYDGVERTSWYRDACDVSFIDVLRADEGIVCSTVYGDGRYKVKGIKNEGGLLIALRIQI